MKYLNLIILCSLYVTIIQSRVIEASDMDLSDETSNESVQNESVEIISIQKTKDSKDDLSEYSVKIRNNIISYFNRAQKGIDGYKAYRDSELNSYIEKIEEIKEEAKEELSNLEENEVVLESNIKEIEEKNKANKLDGMNELKMTGEEYRSKMKILKERKQLITGLMSQDCDECDESFINYKLDMENAKVDQKITDLNSLFFKQASDKELELIQQENEVAKELNTKYSELVDVYKKEIDELKKDAESSIYNKNIVNEWKTYAENVEDVHTIVRTKVEQLFGETPASSDETEDDSDEKGPAYMQDESSNDYPTDDDPDYPSEEYDNSEPKETENTELNYKWIDFTEKSSSVPNDAVLGGEDIDGSPLYVIRKENSYGKYALNRKNAYVTSSTAEFGVQDFKILTAKNYFWCNSNLFMSFDEELPICRATLNESVIPGKLLEDGTCKVGYGLKIHIVPNAFEVLSLHSCKV